jgi:transmembrane sensor
LILTHQANVDAALGFVTGHIMFTDVALRDAIADLDRWYDVDVQLADPALGALPLSGRLAAGSPGDLADILHLLLDVRVVQRGRVLTLYPR